MVQILLKIFFSLYFMCIGFQTVYMSMHHMCPKKRALSSPKLESQMGLGCCMGAGIGPTSSGRETSSLSLEGLVSGFPLPPPLPHHLCFEVGSPSEIEAGLNLETLLQLLVQESCQVKVELNS